MKRRIEQLLNGKFEYEIKPPFVSKEMIEETAEPGEKISGFFDVNSSSDQKLKGYIYSSDPRILFEPVRISGVKNHIVYQVDLTGLSGGDTFEGQFVICTDQGEAALPYRFYVTASEEAEKSSVELSALAEMARIDPEQAEHIFTGHEYEMQLQKSDELQAAIYKQVGMQRSVISGLEEYLIACGEKEPIDISVKESEITIDGIRANESGSIRISRSTWGYIDIDITSDAEFLQVNRQHVTSLDFAGMDLELEYVIDVKALHPGVNYGRVCIQSCYQTIYVDFSVKKRREEGKYSQKRIQKMMRRKLYELYVDLRLRRTDMQAWIDRSQNLVGSYKRAGGDDLMADLFMVQLLYADGKRAKGNRALQEIERRSERFQTEEQYAYYLYLTTFYEHDGEYLSRVEQRIEETAKNRPGSWIFLWLLLFLEENYISSDEAKLEAIRMHMGKGCSSPMLAMEAALIYRKNPYLMRSIGRFEKKILRFCVRERSMTEELLSHVSNLALQSERYDAQLCRILQKLYLMQENEDCLKAVCVQMISGKQRAACDFVWYERGVKADLRINGLYEYYIETMSTVSIEKMPQIIRMYLSYNNTLNYHKKAAVLRDISDHQDSVPQTYRTSRPAIEAFVTEQLSLERIDENLGVLYERFITRKMLTKSLARKLVHLLFTFEITCKNPMMTHVCVIHEGVSMPQIIKIEKGRAQVLIYNPYARIFLMDREGKRYASTTLYQAERFMDSPLLLRYCCELDPELPQLCLYFTGQHEPADRDSIRYYKMALQMPEYTETFKEGCRRKILQYYYENPKENGTYTYLRSINLHDFARCDKPLFLQILTKEGMYEEAFEILERYGWEGVELTSLVRICSQSVLLREYGENEVLLAYCYRCFDSGKYDDNILTYLLMYFEGSLAQMLRIWSVARENELDTMALEEKILMTVVFTMTTKEGSDAVFASYERNLGRKKLTCAYASLRCYEYLVKRTAVDDSIFSFVEKGFWSGEETDEVLQLALLKYYSFLESRDQQRTKTAEKLLEKFSVRGMRFDFYQNFPEEMRRKCQVGDRILVQYEADPEHKVTITWRMKNGEAKTEMMKNVFEGIRVREFVLFETEVLTYTVEEFDEEKLLHTSGSMQIRGQEAQEEDRSMYAELGRMMYLAETQDTEGLRRKMQYYEQQKKLTEQIFTLL